MPLDLHKLFVDVFHPESDECVVVIVDEPHAEYRDHDLWRERREMAVEWQAAWVSLAKDVGFKVLPLVSFPASGAHNANLPLESGDPMSLEEALKQSTLALALTQYSATAPLSSWASAHTDFRAASLPQVARRMEATALSADYAEVARRCQILKDALAEAELARVIFSTGHEWQVDLRFREAKMDDGQLPRGKGGFPIINLPSGESFQVPYEGERAGEVSRTEGEIPVAYENAQVIFHVEGNRIVTVSGDEPKAGELRAFFDVDLMRRNIAELALGCNANAVVWGNVLEDEKAGFHWAYGRSEHLGGVVAPEDFTSPDHIEHQDIVYAKDSPIQVASLVLVGADGTNCEVIKDGDYLI
ncbi:MAG: leucyl aminopeptidase (aminopeptidase T) [Candidatus Latescibacterota bacterium]|jgi:leucyl aminopeptidase (aminopeptidase T)